MSEATDTTTAAAPPGDAPALTGFGAALRAERERQGISSNDMAARLRLHPKQLAAIEAEDIDALPAGPFVRGFVRNYAKELQIDPAPLLAQVAARTAPVEPAGLATGGASRSSGNERLPRVVVIGAAVAALILFGVLGVMATRDGERAEAPPQPASESSAVTPAPPPASGSAPAAESAATTSPDTTASATDTAPSNDASAAGPGAPGAAPSAAPAETASAPPAAEPAPAPKAASNGTVRSLRLVFTEPAWVRVEEADGRVLLSQLNEAGTEQRVAGRPPLRLIIGNAPGVTVDFGGRTIDLKPRTNADNVARLTLE